MDKFLSNPWFFAVFFVSFWVAISFLISALGGWMRLASYYPYTGQVIDRKLNLQSGGLRRFSGYNNCLTIGASKEGLYIAVLFLFRPGHHPIFIPWSEIKVQRKKIIFGRCPVLEFRFNQVPSVPFVILPKLEKFLTEAAGRPLTDL